MRFKKEYFLIVLICLFAAFFLLFILNDRGNNRFFRDQTYNHLTMRALGEAPYGGADIGEVLETIKHVRAGDPESWYQAWNRTANRVALMAENTADPISKGRALLRAHNYYRTAEFLLDPDDPRRMEAYRNNIKSFYAGLDSLHVRYDRITVPYGRGHLNALFFPANDAGSNKPLIVACGGVDSTMEELYFSIAAGARERNYPVLLFEGPGQGEVLREQKMTFIPEWEKPTKAVLDNFISNHKKPEKIILIGMSMGGYLAPRAAAFDSRINGVVAFDVLYDVGAALKAQAVGTNIVVFLHRHNWDALANMLIRIKMKMSPGIRWGANNTKWVTGVSSYSETAEAFDKYTLKNVAKRIKIDVLILAGSKDHLVPSNQVALFQHALTHAKSVTTVVFDPESGGKEHCQDGAVTLWQRTLFEWIQRKFG